MTTFNRARGLVATLILISAVAMAQLPGLGLPFWEFPEGTVIAISGAGDGGLDITLEQNSQYLEARCAPPPESPPRLWARCQQVAVGDLVFARGELPRLDVDEQVFLLTSLQIYLP